MSDPKPIKIWIVEDLQDFAPVPWKFIEQVRNERRATADAFWISGFKWPPRLHEGATVGSVARSLGADDFPDIVVLDLCLGDTLEGDKFLESLRKWEQSAERRWSFVLFWSEYFSLREVRDFVKSKVKEDLRTIEVDKSQYIGASNPLLAKIRDTWQLVEEERGA